MFRFFLFSVFQLLPYLSSLSSLLISQPSAPTSSSQPRKGSVTFVAPGLISVQGTSIGGRTSCGDSVITKLQISWLYQWNS